MSALQVIRGRIIELRRCINAQVYWRRPPGPAERYELWLRQERGPDRKFTINTGMMPARRGHMVRVIVKMSTNPPCVLGLSNESTGDAVNYMLTDPPPLLRVRKFVALPVAFVVMAAGFGDLGIALFVPTALAYLLIVSFSRAINRMLWAKRVDRALADEGVRPILEQ
jgi:hypothetical protein